MKYRNTKTGAVIETRTAINGGNWVEVRGGGATPAAITSEPTETADEPTVKSGKPKSTKRKTAKG